MVAPGRMALAGSVPGVALVTCDPTPATSSCSSCRARSARRVRERPAAPARPVTSSRSSVSTSSTTSAHATTSERDDLEALDAADDGAGDRTVAHGPDDRRPRRPRRAFADGTTGRSEAPATRAGTVPAHRRAATAASCTDTITFTFRPTTPAGAPPYSVEYADPPFPQPRGPGDRRCPADVPERPVPAGVDRRPRRRGAAHLHRPRRITPTGAAATRARSRCTTRTRASSAGRRVSTARGSTRSRRATSPPSVDDHRRDVTARRSAAGVEDDLAEGGVGGDEVVGVGRRSSSGRTRSTTGRTRPSASSGTTSATNAAVAAAFSAIDRARSTVPCSASALLISVEQREVGVPPASVPTITMRPRGAMAASSAVT